MTNGKLPGQVNEDSIRQGALKKGIIDSSFIYEKSENKLLEISFNMAGIGKIKLTNKMPITVEFLKNTFQSYSVTKEIGSGDSPDFYFFKVFNKDGDILCIYSFIEYEDYNSKKIKAPKADDINIDLLEIISPLITDKYGLNVGKTYEDIINLRGKNLALGDNHHDKYIGGDNVYYNIWGEFDRKTEADVSPTDISNEQVKKYNWKIISISWPNPRW